MKKSPKRKMLGVARDGTHHKFVMWPFLSDDGCTSDRAAEYVACKASPLKNRRTSAQPRRPIRLQTSSQNGSQRFVTR